ncbi:MAG: DUF1801 domain-containing protein [Pseudomonadota bacterium]
MAGNKTVPTGAAVQDFLENVNNDQRRADALEVLAMMRDITGEEPRMWGSSIVGFGEYHYRYESGREGDFMKVGFSPRKQALSLYIMGGFASHEQLLARLGTFSTGKSCLYMKKLDDVDRSVLGELIGASWAHMTAKYG